MQQGILIRRAKKMVMDDRLQDSYNSFMVWFRERHPALFTKYGKYIGLPFRENGGVIINPGNNLSLEELDMLARIAHSYYEEQNKQ